MSEENLSTKSKEALKHIRNWIMRYGSMPSVRELMKEMEYKSPRSAMLLIEELERNGFLERKESTGFKLVKDLDNHNSARTVLIPLVGNVACGLPILAEENIEAMIPISISLIRSGSRYFLLRAIGDSMNLAGINPNDLILVKQQLFAENGQKVVALIDDEATIKEFHHKGDVIALLPFSTNPLHKPIILEREFQIQGIVITTIPDINF